jgi:hypothetical protein
MLLPWAPPKEFFFARRVVGQPEIFSYKLTLKMFKNNFTDRPACLDVWTEVVMVIMIYK